ncbi:hypothetical protein F2981_12705 [Sinorhizobium meliloti]|nr:hypothetical protein [Sinorhizobium meliloti]
MRRGSARTASTRSWRAAVDRHGALRQDRPAARRAAPEGRGLRGCDRCGHGGIDTGCNRRRHENRRETRDPAFAKELVERLNHEPGIEAFLTRERDEFLSLPQRVQIARQRGSNLFIFGSRRHITAEGYSGRHASTRSPTRRPTTSRPILPHAENLSDEIAGIPLESEPAEVADILIDLTRRETQLSRSISPEASFRRSKADQADQQSAPLCGVPVLQAPGRALVLLELGFLSTRKMRSNCSMRNGGRRYPPCLPAPFSATGTTAVANGG